MFLQRSQGPGPTRAHHSENRQAVKTGNAQIKARLEPAGAWHLPVRLQPGWPLLREQALLEAAPQTFSAEPASWLACPRLALSMAAR